MGSNFSTEGTPMAPAFGNPEERRCSLCFAWKRSTPCVPKLNETFRMGAWTLNSQIEQWQRFHFVAGRRQTCVPMQLEEGRREMRDVIWSTGMVKRQLKGSSCQCLPFFNGTHSSSSESSSSESLMLVFPTESMCDWKWCPTSQSDQQRPTDCFLHFLFVHVAHA